MSHLNGWTNKVPHRGTNIGVIWQESEVRHHLTKRAISWCPECFTMCAVATAIHPRTDTVDPSIRDEDAKRTALLLCTPWQIPHEHAVFNPIMPPPATARRSFPSIGYLKSPGEKKKRRHNQRMSVHKTTAWILSALGKRAASFVDWWCTHSFQGFILSHLQEGQG